MSSYRLTVQSLIDAGVHKRVANLCEDDPRFYEYINSFQARAILYGRWWGTTQMLDFCVTSTQGSACEQAGACIVLPREVAVIEAFTLNGAPGLPKNVWWSYVNPVCPPAASGCGLAGYAPGLYPWGRNFHCAGWNVSEDRLTVPSFHSTTTGQTIRFYFNPADVGKKVIVQGRDSDNVWVRTTIDDEVQDGEQVTFATTGGEYYTDTVTEWYAGNPLAIIKEVTSYNVQMFGVTDGEVDQELANYEPSETHPQYRRFFLPGNICGGCADESQATLRCIVSLQHVPVSQPNDWLLFQNIPAYLDGIKSELLRDNNDWGGADRLFFGADNTSRNGRGVMRSVKLGGALPTLTAELRKWTGDTTTAQVRRSGVNLVGFV